MEKENAKDNNLLQMLQAGLQMQMHEAAQTIALISPVLWSHYESLTASGFSDEQALFLVSEFQKAMLKSGQ